MTNWQMELMLFSFTFLFPVVCSQRDPEWPWSQAFVKHNAMAGTRKGELSLATVVLQENEVLHEWTWNSWYPVLKGKAGVEARVGCRMINGSNHEKAMRIEIFRPQNPRSMTTKHCVTDKWDCWYNFTLVEPTLVTCRWQQDEIALLFEFKIDVAPDLWDNALSRYTPSTGTPGNKRGLNLSTLVIQGSEVYSRDKWKWNDSLQMAKIEATLGKRIHIGCRFINGSTHHRPTVIKTIYVDSTKPDKYNTDCYKIMEPNSDCWHNFTFIKPTIVYCIWGYKGTELLFEFMIDSNTPELAEINPEPTPPQTLKGVPSKPSISLTPYIFNIGPYVIKHTGQQQILFPTYSLKRVELSMQIKISAIKPTCLPFLSTSYAGWSAWLRRQTFATSQRLKRDVTGILGTGLGVLNSIDAEILANKLCAQRLIDKTLATVLVVNKEGGIVDDEEPADVAPRTSPGVLIALTGGKPWDK
ncbi:uncharacterized protein LOC141735468 [Larus michahellis]|uniref:uncharacterized protein LOC141735468 n=1 Tax=Larus michahellis TaxID=119627 RepID=UPI003D9B4B40